jgi:hypothetical protein
MFIATTGHNGGLIAPGLKSEGAVSERYFEAADAERAALRAAVAAVDHFIAHQPSTHPGADQGLSGAWAALIKVLSLGSPRQLRECPRCGHVSMSDATRCGHCWERLVPVLPAPIEDRQVAGGGADS